MKKISVLSIILCAVLLLQSAVMPVLAAEPVPVVPSTEAQTGFEAPSESAIMQPVTIPFGRVCIENGCRTIEAKAPLSGNDIITETAQAAMIYETTTGTMIYSHNADMKLAPGNLAKMVTALLALELCDLDDEVTVHSRNISRLPAGSQNVNLKEEEKLTVKDLVHCLLLQGANDAAIALAEHISGNMQGFLVLMNDRVKQMGCTNTEFGNVHGLDNVAQHTTARDMVKITMEAMKNDKFVEIFSTTSYTVPATNRSEARKFATQNYMMDDQILVQFVDNRVTGGLAGYADASGAGLICTAESKDSRNMKLVCVILGATRIFAENGWSVLSYGNFNEMTELLEYSFNNFKVVRIVYDGQALEQYSVIDGESDAIGTPHVNIDSVLPADCQMTNLIFRSSVVDGGLTAPIKEDQMLATIEIWYRNSCVAEAELFAMGNVASESQSDITIQGEITAEDGGVSGILGFMGVIGVLLAGAVVIYLGVNAYRRAKRRAQQRRRRANRRRSY